jgi:hypothetical protein
MLSPRLAGRTALARWPQFLVGVFVAIGGEEEFPVADIAAPAAELGGFVMTEGNPVGVVGQLLQTLP